MHISLTEPEFNAILRNKSFENSCKCGFLEKMVLKKNVLFLCLESISEVIFDEMNNFL